MVPFREGDDVGESTGSSDGSAERPAKAPPRIRRILVPIDFSPCSLAALDHTLALCEAHFPGVEVDVLHVWEPPRAPGEAAVSRNALTGSTIARPLYAPEEEMLDQWLASAQARGGLVARRIHEHGEPVPRILEVAARGYDLVVMGTRGTKNTVRPYLGRVSERVARGARCPVLTVGSETG